MSGSPNPRLALLRDKVERDMLDPLRNHGWQCDITGEVEAGEYILLSAECSGIAKSCAVLYSSATNHEAYLRLAGEVDAIFIHGEPYQLQSFAREFADQVLQLDYFHATLIEWNRETSSGKLAPGALDAEVDGDPDRLPARLLLSETPIHAIWLRLRQFQSVRLAQKLIAERATREGLPLEKDAIEHKAQGLAFTLRNAADYFQASQTQPVSQRILSLYYGAMAFAFAEMLARSNGPQTLAEIEERTKQGHGLYAVDGETGDFGDILVGTIRSGFFGLWLATIGVRIADVPAAKPKSHTDAMKLAGETVISLEALFARIQNSRTCSSMSSRGRPGGLSRAMMKMQMQGYIPPASGPW